MVDVPDRAEFDAHAAQISSQAMQITDLQARVAALEEGAVVPPDSEASPDGTRATAPGTVLTSAALNTFELCTMADPTLSYGIEYNGPLDGATHNVTELYAKGGKVYQQAGGWWYTPC